MSDNGGRNDQMNDSAVLHYELSMMGALSIGLRLLSLIMVLEFLRRSIV